jgi:hypothetical protein
MHEIQFQYWIYNGYLAPMKLVAFCEALMYPSTWSLEVPSVVSFISFETFGPWALSHECVLLDSQKDSEWDSCYKASSSTDSSICRPPIIWRYRYDLNRRVYAIAQGSVSVGVFQGLKLPPRSYWGDTDVAMQLLGSYESEVLDELQKSPDRSVLVNLGAADGYYVNGWAISRSD